MKESIEQIWDQVIQGDNTAWDKLVNQYQSLVYSVAIKCRLSMDEAADCFQHTWVALYNNRHKIHDPNGLPGWLATTARREAYLIKKQANKHVEDTTSYLRADSALLPDEELVLMERQAILEGAIALLDDRCARLISLLFFGDEELSYDQIAVKTQISFNSLGPIRMRCLKKLKTIFEEQGIASVRDFLDNHSGK